MQCGQIIAGIPWQKTKAPKIFFALAPISREFFCWPYNFATICENQNEMLYSERASLKNITKKNPKISSLPMGYFSLTIIKIFHESIFQIVTKLWCQSKIFCQNSQFRPNWDKNYKIRLLQLHICRCKFFWTWNLKNVRIVVLAKKFEEESYSQRTKSKASGKKVQNDNF